MNNQQPYELFEYYNARAPEYEAFYQGEFANGISNPEIYRKDTAALSELVPECIRGQCIDIACGTGFWLPLYEKNCHKITLIDQGEDILAECREEINKLGIEDKTEIIRDDIFSHRYEYHRYDTALIGFLISHFSDDDLNKCFLLLRQALKSNGKFVIIDSIWSEEIADIRKTKAGTVTRTLFDGREFQIYKRCFEKSDMETVAQDNDIDLEILYWGNVFFLATGSFK